MTSQNPVVALRNLLAATQWRWILGVSVVTLALISTAVFLSIVIFASAQVLLGTIPSQAEISAFSELFGRIIGPVATIGLTLFATTWLALRVRTAPRWHGSVVGLIVAIATLISDAVFTPPTAPDEWVTIFLAIVVGWLGGAWGRFILTNREMIYQASQALKGADRAGLISAIATHLAGPSVVLIALVKNSGEIERSSAWVSAPNQEIPVWIKLAPAQAEPTPVSAADSLPWRSSLLIGLTGEESLLVASRAKNGFSRSEIQNYRTLTEQVALVLENLKLIEQARETGILQERQRLAGEIHDGLTQGFISIVTQLEMAEARLEHYPPEQCSDLQGLLDQARQTARDNLTAARQMTWALRPDLQAGAPLSQALAELSRSWSATAGIPVSFTTSGDEQTLHPDIETALLRVGREALNNIRKHAHAGQVTMTLTYLNTLVALDVQDNGQGFEPEFLSPTSPDGGFGLKSIREQAGRLGGELSIESALGQGTTIAVSLPVG